MANWVQVGSDFYNFDAAVGLQRTADMEYFLLLPAGADKVAIPEEDLPQVLKAIGYEAVSPLPYQPHFAQEPDL